VDRLDPASGRIRHFSTADGLAGDTVQIAHRDRTGALWFGGRRGLTRLVPAEEAARRAPRVLISGLRIAGARRELSPLGELLIPELALGASENRVEVEYLGIGAGAGSPLQYEYRLREEDPWSPSSADRSVDFARLAPGRYRFEVRAVTAEGIRSAEPAMLSFIVRPPIWRRWWFLLAVASAMLAGLLAVHRRRLRRLLELERVRTRIAADLHDDLGASLSRIAIQSEAARQQVRGQPVAEHMLEDIGATARSLTDSARDMVWAIDPRQDDLKSLVTRLRPFVAELAEARGIAWRLKDPPSAAQVRLGADQRRQLFLLLKEAVTNVVRHAGAGSIAIDLEIAGGELRAAVVDDGRGFEVEAADRPEAAGHGLRNMRARAASIGGVLEIESQPGGGTRIGVRMPLDGRRR
jgi:signal transduction histidine kinase